MRTFKPYPLHWVVESLFDEPSYVERAMFGCRACYLHGELKLVLASQEDPWKGLLVATDKDRHQLLIREIPDLFPHPILPKWLYLPEDNEDFESIAEKLVTLAARNDPRIGVEPKPRKSRKKTTARSRPKKAKSRRR